MQGMMMHVYFFFSSSLSDSPAKKELELSFAHIHKHLCFIWLEGLPHYFSNVSLLQGLAHYCHCCFFSNLMQAAADVFSQSDNVQ